MDIVNEIIHFIQNNETLSEDNRTELLNKLNYINTQFKLIDFKYRRSLKDKEVIQSLLTKTSEDLQKSVEAEKKFIASMSHEIRTPLNSVIGFIDILQTTNLDEVQKKYAKNALISSQHLYTLINDILDVSKLEAGQLDLKEEETNFEELMHECAVIVSTKIVDVKLLIDIPETDYFVYADPIRIKQIFLNLLGNAVKFTTKGHIKLSLLEFKETVRNTISIRACVEDTGIGIPIEKMKYLFSPFKQLHEKKIEGTGLGLFLSKSLAKIQGGDIEVESVEHGGSKFYINFEFKKGSKKELKFRFDNKNILMLDCEDEHRELLFKKFELIGAKTISYDQSKDFKSLIEFLVNMKNIDFALVNLDLFAEKSDILASILHEFFENIIIIGFTYKRKSDKFKFFHSVLTKPFSFYKLSYILNDYLNKKTTNFQEHHKLSTLKVLLAEDVEMNIAFAREMFKIFFNIIIDIAENGIIAIEKSKETDYDVIFMDMQMPVMDGLEATRQIRQFNTKIPIVALTANAMAEGFEEAKDAGMNWYITKPVKKEEVLKILEKVLNCDLDFKSNVDTPILLKSDDNYEFQSIDEKVSEYFHNNFGFSGDELKEMVVVAKSDLKRIIIEIRISIENKDISKTGELSHEIKGALLNCGLKDVAEIAYKLELETRNNIEILELRKILNRLENSLKDFVGLID